MALEKNALESLDLLEKAREELELASVERDPARARGLTAGWKQRVISRAHDRSPSPNRFQAARIDRVQHRFALS